MLTFLDIFLCEELTSTKRASQNSNQQMCRAPAGRPHSPTPSQSQRAARFTGQDRHLSQRHHRDNLSDVYNLDHSHIWSPRTTNGIYNLDIGTNGVYKQTDIEKVVISHIQNGPLAYRHTSSLPTPYMYVLPSPLTYRASHHPPTTMRNHIFSH